LVVRRYFQGRKFMYAIRIHQFGDPDVLSYEETAVPEPGAGEARVKVEMAGVNFIDTYHRTGQYPGVLPLTPGVEAVGVVDAVGSDVADVHVGDRVGYVLQIGSYAGYAIVPAGRLVPVPAGVESATAAALLVQGLTAHYLCTSTFPLQPGDTALVHAAAGGTGLLLVQIARQRGARVIATVSTEEKAELARQAGADEIILYSQSDFEAETKRLTDGRGVDVVYDGVGKTTFAQGLNCLRPRGYMVLFGQASGAVPPLDPQQLNQKGSLFLTRPSLGHYMQDRPELLQRSRDLFSWLAAGELNVRVDQIFPLAEAAAAHRYLEGRQTKGKVLLAV
jgi:NADPH:quinone reductase